MSAWTEAEWVKDEKERIRAYYRDTPKEKIKEDLDRWFAWYNEMRRIPRIQTRTYAFAKKTGLTKLPCVCGRTDVHMHHVDYERWYLIAFLCPRCHRAEHRGKLNKPFELHDLRDLAVADLVAFA